MQHLSHSSEGTNPSLKVLVDVKTVRFFALHQN